MAACRSQPQARTQRAGARASHTAMGAGVGVHVYASVGGVCGDGARAFCSVVTVSKRAASANRLTLAWRRMRRCMKSSERMKRCHELGSRGGDENFLLSTTARTSAIAVKKAARAHAGPAGGLCAGKVCAAVRAPCF
eukprot:2620096-Prymnesium_polylepis.1